MKKIFTTPSWSFIMSFLILISLTSMAQKSKIDSSYSPNIPIATPIYYPSNNLANIKSSNRIPPNERIVYEPINRTSKIDSMRNVREYFFRKKLIFSKYRKATILFKDSTISSNRFINIESPNDYSILEQYNGTIDVTTLKRIVFEKDSLETEYTIFQNGYRGKLDEDENLLYQVLASGKIDLLIKRYSAHEKELLFTAKEYEALCLETDILYIYFNKNLEKVKYKKSYFFEKFREEKLEIMEKFVAQNNTNFRSTNDIKLLINFYNNLF